MSICLPTGLISRLLQELGEAVASLPASRLEALPFEERLRDAIAELHRTRSFEGKRRQTQARVTLLDPARPPAPPPGCAAPSRALRRATPSAQPRGRRWRGWTSCARRWTL